MLFRPLKVGNMIRHHLSHQRRLYAALHERYAPHVDYWERSLQIGNIRESREGRGHRGSLPLVSLFKELLGRFAEEIAEMVRRMVQDIPVIFGRIPGAISFRQFLEKRDSESPKTRPGPRGHSASTSFPGCAGGGLVAGRLSALRSTFPQHRLSWGGYSGE